MHCVALGLRRMRAGVHGPSVPAELREANNYTARTSLTYYDDQGRSDDPNRPRVAWSMEVGWRQRVPPAGTCAHLQVRRGEFQLDLSRSGVQACSRMSLCNAPEMKATNARGLCV